MDEARRHPLSRQTRHPLDKFAVKSQELTLHGPTVAIDSGMGCRNHGVIDSHHVAQQSLQTTGIAEIQKTFASAKTQVRARDAHHHRTSSGRRLIAAIQILSGFNQRQSSTRCDAKCMQGFRGDHLPNTSFQGESSITSTAPWRRA